MTLTFWKVLVDLGDEEAPGASWSVLRGIGRFGCVECGKLSLMLAFVEFS